MEKLYIIERNVLVELEWSQGSTPVKSVSLSMNSGHNEEIPQKGKRINNLLREIRSYLKGSIGKLSIDMLDLNSLSPFAEKILCELRKSVPAGKTISYGELAKLAGHPGAARAVGSVLRNNPFPLFFPCHRVIKSNGDLGLFQGSREGGALKQKLLDIEAGR